jgi:ABC-type lipoprotein release transport system permease subunit
MELRKVCVLVGAALFWAYRSPSFITRSVSNLLYGLTPDDPLTVIASVGALLLSAFAAGFVPARQASRVDSIVALRIE